MRIETKSIREGARIGEIVWICDYRQPDISIKPIRHVPPTKVIIVSNDELPKNKTVYYSATHFAPLSKKGEPLKKIISPVDNTGYRTRSGDEVAVFDNEGECIQHYQSQCDAIMAAFEYEKTQVIQRLDESIRKVVQNRRGAKP
jgi:hypothetical protein